MVTSMPTNAATLPKVGAVPASAQAVLPALFAVLLGLLVVGVTGFSPMDSIHNGTHNARHTNAFPCH